MLGRALQRRDERHSVFQGTVNSETAVAPEDAFDVARLHTRSVAGERALAACGVACYFACDRLMQIVMLAQDAALYNFCLVLGGAYLVVLAAVSIVVARIGLLPSRAARTAVGAVAALSGAALTFASDAGVRVALASVVMACLAFMVPFWAWALCRMRRREAMSAVSCALVFSVAAVLVGRLTPASAPWLVASSLLASCLCAASMVHAGDSRLDPAVPVPDEDDRASAPLPSQVSSSRLFVVVFAACALVAQFFAGVVMQPFVISSNRVTLEFALIVAVLAVILLAWSRFSRDADLNMLYFVPFVILIVGLVLFSTSLLNSLILPVAFVLAASTCMFGFSLVIMRDLVVRDGAPCFLVFALGMVLGEGTVGMCIGIMANKLVSMNFSTVTSVAIAGIAVFALFHVFSSQMHTRSIQIVSQQVVEANKQAAEAVELAAQVAEEAAVVKQNAAEAVARAEQKLNEQAGDIVQAELQKKADEYNLTPREREVLVLVVQGLSNTDIGERLFISRSAVKFHMANLFKKCGVRTRSELADLFRIM